MPQKFDTTSWSVVAAAQGTQSAAARDALAVLCERYWLPLYAYVRRRGYSRFEAEDLTQEFFARLLSRDLVLQADRERGRFRTFLLGCLNHFLMNQRDRQRAEKRGGDAPHLPLDFEQAETHYALHGPYERDPQTEFDRQWAETLLATVTKRIEEDYRRRGNPELFRVLRSWIGQSSKEGDYAAAAEALGMTEGALRVAVHRLRRQFAALTREEIAQTVADEASVREELRYLIRVLGG